MGHGVPITWYLILSAILFGLGVAGFLFRKNVITVFIMPLGGRTLCPAALKMISL